LDISSETERPKSNKLMWGIGCGIPLLGLIWLSYIVIDSLGHSPSHYQAITPTQKFEWGSLYVVMRIPYSANFPIEELDDSYETSVFIDATPLNFTSERKCLFKPHDIIITETATNKTLLDQKGIWGDQKGAGRVLSADGHNQINLFDSKFNISPDQTAFNVTLKYTISCGEDKIIYVFEQNLKRTKGSSVNTHIR